jgi:hypothetical protein
VSFPGCRGSRRAEHPARAHHLDAQRLAGAIVGLDEEARKRGRPSAGWKRPLVMPVMNRRIGSPLSMPMTEL